MARITFEVSQEQHTYIKMMAASKGISIRDYFLSQIEKSIPSAETKRVNRRTRKVLEETDKHQNLHYAATVVDFYEELGMIKYLAGKGEGFIGGILKTLTPKKEAAAA